MKLDAESAYMQLGRVIETMPDLNINGEPPPEIMQWLARACALMKVATDDGVEALTFQTIANSFMASQSLRSRESYASDIRWKLYKALANAELMSPPAVHGAFIPAGNPFDALAAIGKVLKSALSDLFIIDPYMDHTVLTDFISLAPDNAFVRLMADERDHKPSLKPAVVRWTSQNGGNRLEARLATPKSLHDRLIIADATNVWTLTQSLNAFANRSPAAIVRIVDLETAKRKIAAYEDMWQLANQI